MVHTDAVQENVAVEASGLPAEAEIRAQVDRILSSPEFDVPNRARKFLTYVIEETIAGRADRIKAYSIALEVFGRDASFDAQGDPVVRIEAGRVRRALERYYFTAGQNDPIIITIPKGGYVPAFTRSGRTTTSAEPSISLAEQSATSARPFMPRRTWLSVAAAAFLIVALVAGNATWRLAGTQGSPAASAIDVGPAMPDVPRLLVEPFEDLSETEGSTILARGLTNEIVGQIAKFKEIMVIVDPSKNALGEARAIHGRYARYALEGSVQVEEDKLRLTARLINRRDGSVVWANNYDENLTVHELLETESDIARKVATAVAQPYGIIFHADAAQLVETPPDDWEAYACTLAYYAYRVDLKPDTHMSVRACLERAVGQFPTYATAWALLSLTFLDELRFRYRINADSTPPLDRALLAARRALDLDPENVRGLQAHMTALFFQKKVDAALEVGARAIAINPNDTELIGEYGMRLAHSGRWKRGSELILEALNRNPGPLGYYETGLALCFYMQRDYKSAAAWIRKADVQANPIYHVVAAAIFGANGETTAAAIERDWLMNNAPQLLGDIGRELAMRNIRPEDQAHFVDGLRRAKLSIPGF